MNRIRNWFRSLGRKMQIFLYGRYGFDELSQFLSWTALVCILTGLFAYPGFFCGVSMALYLITMFRTYSRNITKRQREREAYLRMVNLVRNWFRLQKRKFSERKTHRYFKCGQCKTSLRVPKGKGKIKICCPKCGTEVVRKT